MSQLTCLETGVETTAHTQRRLLKYTANSSKKVQSLRRVGQGYKSSALGSATYFLCNVLASAASLHFAYELVITYYFF